MDTPLILNTGDMNLGSGDIGSITIPTEVTRYAPLSGAVGQPSGVLLVSAEGDVTGATFQLRTGPNGGGAQVGSQFSLIGVSASVLGAIAITHKPVLTGGTIYVHQNGAAANAGVIRLYLAIVPLA